MKTFYFPFYSLHIAKFQNYFCFDDYKCRFSFCQYDGISINFSNSFIIVSCFYEIVLDFPTYLQKNVFLCLSHCQLGYLCNIFVDFIGKAKSIDKFCAFCNTRFSQWIIGTHLIRLEETFWNKICIHKKHACFLRFFVFPSLSCWQESCNWHITWQTLLL